MRNNLGLSKAYYFAKRNETKRNETKSGEIEQNLRTDIDLFSNKVKITFARILELSFINKKDFYSFRKIVI